MSENLSYLSGRKGLTDNLFERLADSTDFAAMTEEYHVPIAPLFGTRSFYDLLRRDNADKKVFVCNGSACLLAGTQDALREELKAHFHESEIGELCCLGRCHENHAFQLDGKNYSGNPNPDLATIQSGDQAATRDRYAVGNLGKPVLTLPEGDCDQYFGLLQQILSMPREQALEAVKLSGLRGRGGAGFPMGLKLESCMRVSGDEKYIVCNADEGDPGAYSDRYLLEQRPLGVLFGMMVAGYIVGASHGVLYIRAEYPESIDAMQAALDSLRQLNWLGQRIRGTGFSFDFKVIKAQGAYICGEETALLSSIEGQRPEVRVRPPYPTEKGLFNLPTVVNNVETFACLHYIFEHGGEAFRQMGTAQSSGTKLMSLDGFFRKPGVYEVEMGTLLSQVIYDIGGGFKEPAKALHIGGPLGGLVPLSEIDKLVVSFESFKSAGFELGHGSVVTIPASYPIARYIEHLFEFCAHESCGKCFPCRIGSQRGKELFAKARNDGYKIDRELLTDLLDTMRVGSLCALGGGLPLPIRNALTYFGEELNAVFA
jgi:NADH-quinone oxidoreductase subunit F